MFTSETFPTNPMQTRRNQQIQDKENLQASSSESKQDFDDFPASNSSSSDDDYDDDEKVYVKEAPKKKVSQAKGPFFALESLPVDILLWIMNYIPMESKYALTRSSKTLFYLLPPNPNAENHVRWKFPLHDLNEMKDINYPWICYVRLCHDKAFKICGCDRCGRQRIRDPNLELGYRLCGPCLNEMTIHVRTLQSKFELSSYEIKDVPSIYRRWFLVPSINKILQEKYGYDLNDPEALQNEVQQRRLLRYQAIISERNAKKQAEQRAKLMQKEVEKNQFAALSDQEKRNVRKQKMLAHCAALNPPLQVEDLESFSRFCQRTEYSINASSWVKKFRAEIEQAEE